MKHHQWGSLKLRIPGIFCHTYFYVPKLHEWSLKDSVLIMQPNLGKLLYTGKGEMFLNWQKAVHREINSFNFYFLSWRLLG